MTSPTKWSLYYSNEEAWEAMLADCAKAKKSISLEQYIFSDDEFGRKLIDVCAERAQVGVKVRFLWDAAGSFSFFGGSIVEKLKGRGIELVFWRTLIPGYFNLPNLRSWFLRNHRRSLIIDEEIGYTGSICVDDNMRGWRDTNVRLEGRVVDEMLNAFERMWARSLKRKPLPKPLGRIRGSEFSYITNHPVPGKKYLYKAVLNAVRGAHDHIYITTPYFSPTRRLAHAIKTAARRGVDVRLVLPDRTDYYPLLDLGARSFFSSMLEAGVRIFLYPSEGGSKQIHSKAIVVDGDWSATGSLNFDHVSLLYNFEANIVSTNESFAEELTEHFTKDVGISEEVSKEKWLNRYFLEKLPELAVLPLRGLL